MLSRMSIEYRQEFFKLEFWTYLWTSLIPPAPPLGWLYDIECGGNGCGGPAVVWPREPDKSDWGCWEEACWPEPTWTDRIAASISFRRCHHFTYFVTNLFNRNLPQKYFSFHFQILLYHWLVSTNNLNELFFLILFFFFWDNQNLFYVAKN